MTPTDWAAELYGPETLTLPVYVPKDLADAAVQLWRLSLPSLPAGVPELMAEFVAGHREAAVLMLLVHAIDDLTKKARA